MMKFQPEYIVCTPSFDVNIGGSLFLHGLAVRLQKMGHRVALTPLPRYYEMGRRAWLKAFLVPPKCESAPGTTFKVVRRREINENAIVIYPEIVKGNPLGARNVVRWLLNKPGLLHPFEPALGEIYFKAGNFCEDVSLTGGAPLLTCWEVNPVYYNRGEPSRTSTCYMVRKGSDRELNRHPEGAICLDGRTHAEIAEVFNKSHTFYCYDEMTLYAQYAAICGCISVVVPKYFSNHDEYVATRSIARYGVSYGFEHIDHARSTQHLVRGLLQELELQNLETVERFVEITIQRFC
jgi:hypothetical protein